MHKIGDRTLPKEAVIGLSAVLSLLAAAWGWHSTPPQHSIAPHSMPQTTSAPTMPNAAPTEAVGYTPSNGGNMGDIFVLLLGGAGAAFGIWHDIQKGQNKAPSAFQTVVVEDAETEKEQVENSELPSDRPPQPTETPSVSASWRERRSAFRKQLKADAPYLLQVLEATPILCAGPQRSGKTTLATAIALSRQALCGHTIKLATPHAHDKFPSGFEVFPQSWEGVEQAIAHYFELISKGDRQPMTLIFDEFTNYAGAELEGADGLMMSFLAESQKHEKFVIGLAHGLTNAALGGAKGTAQMRAEGLVIFERKNQLSETGRRSPSPLVKVSGLTETPVEFELPDWFIPETILEIFPELEQGKEAKQGDADPSYASDVLDAVYLWAQKQDKPVKAVDVQRARLPQLDGYKAAQIRGVFLALEKAGRGITDGLDAQLTYSPNR